LPFSFPEFSHGISGAVPDLHVGEQISLQWKLVQAKRHRRESLYATAQAVDSGYRSAKIDFAGNPAADRGCVKAVRQTVGSGRTGSCEL
jgi:hypothetical protein